LKERIPRRRQDRTLRADEAKEEKRTPSSVRVFGCSHATDVDQCQARIPRSSAHLQTPQHRLTASSLDSVLLHDRGGLVDPAGLNAFSTPSDLVRWPAPTYLHHMKHSDAGSRRYFLSRFSVKACFACATVISKHARRYLLLACAFIILDVPPARRLDFLRLVQVESCRNVSKSVSTVGALRDIDLGSLEVYRNQLTTATGQRCHCQALPRRVYNPYKCR
jgi:hypothetical protein